MEFYIFRHGEKEKNGLFIGQTDVELTTKGRKQNQEIAQKIFEFKVEKIFTSDLKRTFIEGGEKQKALREIDFGEWEKLSWSEIEQKYPQKAVDYLADPLHFYFPGGESHERFQKRILQWLKKLKKSNYQRVGIVTHEGVIKIIVNYLRGEDFWNIKVGCGEGLKIKDL